MSSLRPAMSRVTGLADADRSTAGSGGGRLGGSRAGERRGCGPWPPGVVGVPLVLVGLEGGCCMVVVAAGMRLGFIAVRLRRLGGGLSRRWPGLRRRDGDRSERRGLYLR